MMHGRTSRQVQKTSGLKSRLLSKVRSQGSNKAETVFDRQGVRNEKTYLRNYWISLPSRGTYAPRWDKRGSLTSRAYKGPWGVVEQRYVPAPVHRVPRDYRVVYEKEKHIPYGQWKKQGKNQAKAEREEDKNELKQYNKEQKQQQKHGGGQGQGKDKN